MGKEFYNFFISFTLFGYGFSALAFPGSSILYRLLVLILSIYYIVQPIFIGLGQSKSKSILKSDKNSSSKKNTTIYSNATTQYFLFLLVFFLIVYTYRLLYDTSVYSEDLILSKNEYRQFWFGITLIPSFLFIKQKSLLKSKLLEYLFLFTFFVSLLSSLRLGSAEGLANFGGRLSSQGFNPISVGYYSASLIICSTIKIINNLDITSKKRQFTFKKLTPLMGFFFGSISLIFSASRGPIISLLVTEGIILILFFNKNKLSLSWKKARLILVLFFGLFVFGYLTQLSQSLGSRFTDRIGLLFQSLLSKQDISGLSEGRNYRYADSLELISSNYLFGSSLEIPNIGYPHNLIIEGFLTTGLIGGSVFLLLYMYGLYRSIRLININGFKNEILCCFYIQYAVAGLFSGSLYASSMFWYLLFYVLSSKFLFIKTSFKKIHSHNFSYK